jgi:uncharacterized protein YcaQ
VARRLITLAALRSAALARTLFAPRALAQAIARLGFLQADPIRAPARAQDLTFCAIALKIIAPAIWSAPTPSFP